MRLNLLLKIHDSAKNKYGLKDAFGDAYLLNQNLIYRNLRDLALKRGYKFTEADRDYLLMPLVQLSEILREKSIPYRNEVRLLKKLAKSMPPNFDIFEMPVLPNSNHFHESAHCVAEQALALSTDDSRKGKILNTILAESFANATEALSYALVNDETHLFFLERNNYIYFTAEMLEILRTLGRENNLRSLFKFIFISYVYSNFLYETLSDQDFFDACALFTPEMKISARKAKHFRRLFQHGLDLSPGFRLLTTQFYFKSLGYAGSVERILDFDFIQYMKKKPIYFKIIDEMAHLAVNGVQRSASYSTL